MIEVKFVKDTKVKNRAFKKGNTATITMSIFIELARSKSVETIKNAKEVLPKEVYNLLVSEQLIKEDAKPKKSETKSKE